VSDQAINDRYLRQLSIYNPNDRQQDSVTLIGCGGIGSFTASGLAKLGVPNLTLIDPDEVEDHNIPNQLFHRMDVGQSKVSAVADYISDEFNNIDALAVSLPHEDVALEGLVISGLDSMQARHDIWHECIRLKPRVTRYLDARISGEFIIVYSVNPSDMNDVRKYEEQALYDDDEAEDISCTARGIIDVGLQVSSLLVRMTRRHFNHDEIKNITMMNQESYVTTQGAWLDE